MDEGGHPYHWYEAMCECGLFAPSYPTPEEADNWGAWHKRTEETRPKEWT